MHLHKPTGENTRAGILCTVYAFILLFFLSPDSYLRDLFGRCDSAWFFTAGKAWMNGMVPYVDFADSKGPLLWLIYGIGYLLNHHSYVGVFWLSVGFYAVTLFLAYKLCRLYLSEKPSAVAIASLPFFLFFPLYHFEVRAEDFCNTFLMFTLYALCRVLHGWKGGEACSGESGSGPSSRSFHSRIYGTCIDARSFLLLSFFQGVSWACCLMIKWNIAVMVLPLMAVFLLYSFRSRHFSLSMGGWACGALLVVVPFVLYLWRLGAFDDFLQEYFVNTTSTVGVEGEELSLTSLLGNCFGKTKTRVLVVLLLLLGLSCFAWKRGRVYWWLPVCFMALWVALTGIHCFPYYLSLTAPFFLFIIILVVRQAFLQLRWATRHTAALCWVVAIVGIGLNAAAVQFRLGRVAGQRQAYYRACYVMAQIDRPKILCYSHDYGVGVPVGALPACKYWAGQNGATEEMKAEREAALEGGIPDFVVVAITASAEADSLYERVESAGYVYYGTTIGEYYPTFCKVYGRKGLKPAPEDFRVSCWDVWLKRNIFGI